MAKLPKKEKGFTLVEIIIALVAFSVLAVMVVNEHATYIARTVESRQNLQYTLDIYSIMEKITLDYDVNMDLTLHNPSPTSTNDLKTKIGAEGGETSNTYYGNYYVINNDYYSCNASTTIDYTFKKPNSDNATLLVTIAAPQNHNINVTNLFSK